MRHQWNLFSTANKKKLKPCQNFYNNGLTSVYIKFRNKILFSVTLIYQNKIHLGDIFDIKASMRSTLNVKCEKVTFLCTFLPLKNKIQEILAGRKFGKLLFSLHYH